MKIGVICDAFGLSLEENIRKAKELGLEGVQLISGVRGVGPEMTSEARAALIELRNRITEGESREILALIAANEAYHKASEVLSKVTKALGSAIDANEKAYGELKRIRLDLGMGY